MILDSRVLNNKIIEVLNLADEDNLVYEKADLVLFAKSEIMKGIKDAKLILTVFKSINEEYGKTH